ncbi:hypothetical protein C2G38_2043334 [Gigaspora rosea]|uniref:Uncharacterized protein n=1 Tax=Gigaspora rosea TaxID=44941 RepID=A0A397UN10_9GLOM|nr:hypothetical protein C2G38_2043334 [Gigaspora rosea]
MHREKAEFRAQMKLEKTSGWHILDAIFRIMFRQVMNQHWDKCEAVLQVAGRELALGHMLRVLWVSGFAVVNQHRDEHEGFVLGFTDCELTPGQTRCSTFVFGFFFLVYLFFFLCLALPERESVFLDKL